MSEAWAFSPEVSDEGESMRAIRVVTPILFFVGILGAAVVAQATVYNFANGSLSVSATDTAGTVCCSGSGDPLTGDSVTFNAGNPDPLPAFLLTAAPMPSIPLSGDMSGKTISLNSLMIQPDSVTYSSSATGSNPYTFTAGEVDVSGSVTLNFLPGTPTKSFSFVNPSLTGQIQTGAGGFLVLNGITIASLTGLPNVPGGALTIKGDILLSGIQAVPEPSTMVMLGTALMGLAVARRRRF